MISAVTILLVDEEPLLRRATALMLTKRGGQVSAVGSIGEAVALTERRLFDVAVIDLSPKGPSPAELVAQMRGRGMLPRRLVVCSSAPLARDDAQPFTAILAKPYVFERLLTAVFGASVRRRPTRSGVFTRVRAGTPQRALATSLRGTRRAARARRDRG